MIRNNVPIFNGGESIVLAYSRLAAQGKSVYRPEYLNDFPFAYPIYPPVYYYVCGWLFKIFGVSNGVGRCVAFLSTITSGVFIGLIVKQRTDSGASGRLAALIYFSMTPVLFWAAQNRVDQLCLALSLSGLWVYFRFERQGVAWLLCVPFFVLSLFTKQNNIVPAAALFILLFFQNRKRAFTLFAACAAACGGVFLLVNLITHGGFFLHIVRFNSIALDPGRIVLLGGVFIADFLLILPFGFLLYRAIAEREFEFESGFVSAALFVALMTLGYWGSSTNYFLPLCAALALFYGAFHAKMRERPKAQPIVLCLLFAALAQNLTHSLPYAYSYLKQGDGQRNEIQIAVREMQQRAAPDAPVLYEDIQIPLLLNRRIDFYSTQDFNTRFKQGLYDRDYLLESIQNKRWEAIVLTGNYEDPARKPMPAIPWLTMKQLRAVKQNYRPVPAFNKKQQLFALYIRKP